MRAFLHRLLIPQYNPFYEQILDDSAACAATPSQFDGATISLDRCGINRSIPDRLHFHFIKNPNTNRPGSIRDLHPATDKSAGPALDCHPGNTRRDSRDRDACHASPHRPA